MNPGQGRSLVAKLETALKKLDQLNIRGAKGALKAFSNEVEALVKASIIPRDLGRSWLVSINEINRMLGR